MTQKFMAMVAGSMVLSTALLAQAPQQRKYSDHYYERTAQFNREAPIRHCDIVMLGDSLTEGGDWMSYFKDRLPDGVSVVNRGIIGDDAPGIYDRLDQVIPAAPRKIFFLCGVNDISHDLTARQVLADIEKVIAEIVEKCPDTRLYIQSLLPFNEEKVIYKALKGKNKLPVVNEVNAGLRKMARKYGLKYIDLYDRFTPKGSDELDPHLTRDGLHINAEGYAIWADAIKKYVK